MAEQELREQSAEELIRELTWIVSRVNQGLHLNDGHLDLIEEAARRLALLPKDEWRTMESAPKDGTIILIGRPDERFDEDYCHVARWSDDWWQVHDGKEDRPLRGSAPRIWQPLPAPPTLISQQEADHG
jgi:hypothetical protein